VEFIDDEAVATLSSGGQGSSARCCLDSLSTSLGR